MFINLPTFVIPCVASPSPAVPRQTTRLRAAKVVRQHRNLVHFLIFSILISRLREHTLLKVSTFVARLFNHANC